jgi:hypothetical protein
MQKNKIERSKDGKGKTMYIPLSVYRSGKAGLTISCPDPENPFKFGTTPEQLEKFKEKLEELFSANVDFAGIDHEAVKRAEAKLPRNWRDN